jgi:hypothetical protein
MSLQEAQQYVPTTRPCITTKMTGSFTPSQIVEILTLLRKFRKDNENDKNSSEIEES